MTFLASLELSRLRKMRLHQEKTYAEIYLELLESLKNFDMNMARGFEAEGGGAISQVEHAMTTLEGSAP